MTNPVHDLSRLRMVFAVVMGVLGGLFPAWRAARQPVVQALRG
jgi:ABC-type lipoprotein release transport system permease subunit